MLRGDGRDLASKFLQNKLQDNDNINNHHHQNKPSSKVLTKESSFRVLYYGRASVAVPFMWESQPGTPKHPSSETSLLPPLTPPPSYQFSPGRANSMNSSPMQKKNNNYLHFKSTTTFFNNIFPRAASRKSHVSRSSLSSPSVSSSSGSSSYSQPSHRRSCFHQGSRSGEEDMLNAAGSPTSTLCFGGGRDGNTGNSGDQSDRKKNVVKNAWLSIVGHGNGTA